MRVKTVKTVVSITEVYYPLLLNRTDRVVEGIWESVKRVVLF